MTMTQTKLKVDGVFEGGGVKGIGLVGAVAAIEEAGYEFVNLAGTSAGAIVATLLAAGYSAAEVKQAINDIDFSTFEDPSMIGRIPFVGVLIEEIFHKGLYKGDVFLNLMRSLLAEKGIHTFHDLIRGDIDNRNDLNDDEKERYRFKVRVVATDISRGRMLVLPQDIRNYKMAPEDLEVALAVRMSMSIPYFFEPIKLENSYIVDGGVLSNFPVELFDSAGIPQWPTFGFKLVLSDQASPSQMVQHPISGPISELVALFLTAMEAHDAYYLSNDKFARTIAIDTLGIASTDFNLTPAQKEDLFVSGERAAKKFLDQWNFNEYKALYRSGKSVPTRRELVLPKTKPLSSP
jgi:NTE family protein